MPLALPPGRYPPRCARCGGYVDDEGRTVQPLEILSLKESRTALEAPRRPSTPVADPDPRARLTPGQRYTLALERRDSRLTDRRVAGGGRRATDLRGVHTYAQNPRDPPE